MMAKTKNKTQKRNEFVADISTALCGGSLALSLLLVVGLLGLLAYYGLSHFWQKPVHEFTLEDGRRVFGEIHNREEIPDLERAGKGTGEFRLRIRVGNRELTGADFEWIDEKDIATQELPEDVMLLERLEWGPFYGRLAEIQLGGEPLVAGPEETRTRFEELLVAKREELEEIHEIEGGPIGDVNYEIEALRLARRRVEMSSDSDEERARQIVEIDRHMLAQQRHYEELAARLSDIRERFTSETAIFETADGTRHTVPIGFIVRSIEPNQLGVSGRIGLYTSRVWEFVSEDPRESNTEGGIFPAIFGTVLMVFLMSFAVTPLGVLAGVYLREYAKEGMLVRAVRIAVNNLAGVPSIVFGVFGLGFFVYLVGGTVDQLFYAESLPTPTYGTGGILWASLTLALLTVPVVIVAAEEGLAAVPRIVREGSLALGATKFETIWKVVIPAAAPGILTGMILAMARAAGEVAPLMIVGMVKLAPDLPIDHHFPFVHMERKFMHLGFHIYDVGFQSPNVEATKPLVFATALLLVAVVVAMNLLAIGIRNHLRRKYSTSAV